MGVSHSPQEFARKIHDLADATEKRQKQILTEGAQATKAIMLGTATSRGMTPGSKIAGKRWTVRYDLNPGTLPAALVRFTGPFHLVENATRPHEITPRKGRAGRRGRATGARVLKIGDNFRPSASHPGTRGKHIFKTGRALAGQKVTTLMADRLTGVWRSVIR